MLKKVCRCSLLLVVLVLLAAPSGGLMYPIPAPQSGCGLVPLKPLVPIGCRDLVAQCVCDENGQNCHWVWVCVK